MPHDAVARRRARARGDRGVSCPARRSAPVQLDPLASGGPGGSATVLEPRRAFDFTLMNSVTDMWKAKVYPLSLCVLLFSGVWPCVSSARCCCWMLPTAWRRPRARARAGHARHRQLSLLDTFVMVMMMVSSLRLCVVARRSRRRRAEPASPPWLDATSRSRSSFCRAWHLHVRARDRRLARARPPHPRAPPHSRRAARGQRCARQRPQRAATLRAAPLDATADIRAPLVEAANADAPEAPNAGGRGRSGSAHWFVSRSPPTRTAPRRRQRRGPGARGDRR